MDQDLINYLDQRFSSIDQRFSHMDQRISTLDQRFSIIDQRVSSLDERFQQQLLAFREETRQEFRGAREGLEGVREGLETDIRRAYVTIEGLHDEVRLVAEGVSTTNERMAHNQGELLEKLESVESLNRSLYTDLDFRLRKLAATG